MRGEGERQSVGTFGFIATVGTGAASLGLAVITATVFGVELLKAGREASLSPALYLLFGGTLAGVLAAAAMAWWLLRPIASAYRRGALAMVCGFATVILMLVCIPVHQLFGRAGLLGLAALSLLTATILARRARRWVLGL